VAAVTVPWRPEALAVVDKLLRDVQSPVSDQQQIFALLVIGEIGRHMYLFNSLYCCHIWNEFFY
jgi:cullin-associated NEDD8-dissociated protein 1